MNFLAYIWVCLYKKNKKKQGCRQWVETEKTLTPAVCLRETGTRKLSKSWSDKTNKRLTQRRENVLMLIDVSSLRICYYFHRPRTTPKAKPSSSHNNTGCDNALLCGSNVIFRTGAGCLHSTGKLKPSSVTFSFSCQVLTRSGSVGQSSWRFIPRSQR